MIDWTSDIIATVLVLGVYGIIFIAAELWYRLFHPPVEITRKFAHGCSGLMALSFPSIFSSPWTVLVLGILFYLVLAYTRKRRLLGAVHNVDRQTDGAVYFPLALALTFLLASLTGTFVFYYVAMTSLALADALAGVIGKRWGRRLYTIRSESKSLEGSLSFLVVSFLTAFLLLRHVGEFSVEASIGLALLAGVGGTLIEAFSFRGTDNLSIPLGVWLLLSVAG